MLALLLTVLVLSCLRGLKSNTRSIHSNTAAAMFLSELVFLLGVNQTEQQVSVCVAARWHYGLDMYPTVKLDSPPHAAAQLEAKNFYLNTSIKYCFFTWVFILFGNLWLIVLYTQRQILSLSDSIRFFEGLLLWSSFYSVEGFYFI